MIYESSFLPAISGTKRAGNGLLKIGRCYASMQHLVMIHHRLRYLIFTWRPYHSTSDVCLYPDNLTNDSKNFLVADPFQKTFEDSRVGPWQIVQPWHRSLLAESNFKNKSRTETLANDQLSTHSKEVVQRQFVDVESG